MTTRMGEGMTATTDALLALACAAMAVRLGRSLAHRGDRAGPAAGAPSNAPDGQPERPGHTPETGIAAALFVGGLAAASTAAGAGAVAHGAKGWRDGVAARRAWGAALRCSTLSSGLFLCGVVVTTRRGPRRALLMSAAATKTAVEVQRTGADGDFRATVAGAGASMVGALALVAPRLLDRDAFAWWTAAGVTVGALGAGVQQMRWGAGRLFGHNDRFHALQAVSFYALYRAGLALRRG